MRTKLLMVLTAGYLLMVGSAFAQMGGGGMGGGHMGGGMGHGMNGAGGMVQGMRGNTLTGGYLNTLNPIQTPGDAKAAIQAFINSSNSSLQISDLWEYGTCFKAELVDGDGQKAFDLMVEKFTGAVMPEMDLSMMLNASYGKGLYKRHTFRKNLIVTPDQATTLAQTFINNNGLGYSLGTPETYPGYYKFHTTDANGEYGMEIMVNGYNGQIWMNTFLGLPLAKY